MFLLYHALVFLLLPGICGLLLIKLARRRDYLGNFFERLGNLGEADNGFAYSSRMRFDADFPSPPRFWLHAVSAGEATAGIPLLAALRRRYPDSYIAISTSTPAGRAILAGSRVRLDRIFYCPLDFALVVRRVAAQIAPTIFVLVETDLWPVLLQCLVRRQVPVLLVNGRISQRRVRARFLFRPVFRLLSHICVQTKVDAERLARIGVQPDKISITGNLKFAQALAQLEGPALCEPRHALPAGAVLLIAGSTHPGEEQELLECHRRLRAGGQAVLLMVAPRHLERLESIAALIQARGCRMQRWSQFEAWRDDRITVVDSVGNLPLLYRLAHFVFVGGSFVKRGGHNILEPAAWGKPIFFGPFMENYSSIAETAEREGAAIRVANGAELAERIAWLMQNPARAKTMGEKASALVRSNQGVVERDLAAVEALLLRARGAVRSPFNPSAARTALALLFALQPLWP